MEIEKGGETEREKGERNTLASGEKQVVHAKKSIIMMQ